MKPDRSNWGGRRRGAGRKATDIRNLTATPPELPLDPERPVTATADVTLWWCPFCRATWWETTEARYYDDSGMAATATVPGQAEHHINGCPNADPA